MSIQSKSIEKAPWIKGQIGIKLDKFIAFAKQHVDDRGWLNIDIKESKNGEWYCELNTFKKTLQKPESLKEEASDEPF